MTYALVVIERPDLSNPDNIEAWNDLLSILSCNKGSKVDHPSLDDPRIIGEGIFQMNIRDDAGILVGMLSFAQEIGLPYRLALLDRKPDWIYPENDQVEAIREIFVDCLQKHRRNTASGLL